MKSQGKYPTHGAIPQAYAMGIGQLVAYRAGNCLPPPGRAHGVCQGWGWSSDAGFVASSG